MKKGFTLVEMLVVIAVVSIVGVIITTIFIRSLRGSNKAQIISSIKQNGQSVLENMDKTIRNSDDVVCPPITPPATIASSNNLVVVSEGTYTRYRFKASSSTANGLIQQDNPDRQDVAGSSPPRKETGPEFESRVCGANDQLSSQALILTDTNPQTGVSVESGLFTRNRPAGFRDQVTINFDLKPGVAAPEAITGQIDPVTFKTTVQLR